jgi:hypothetical protein
MKKERETKRTEEGKLRVRRNNRGDRGRWLAVGESCSEIEVAAELPPFG